MTVQTPNFHLNLNLLTFSVQSCDDDTWKVVEKEYDACVEEKSVELAKLGQEEKGDIISLE